jgi:hypothetical protein
VDALRLYIRPSLAAQVYQVALLGAQWDDFQINGDATATWLELYNLELPAQPAGSRIPISVWLNGSHSELCATPAGAGSPECEWQAFGSWDADRRDYSCCPHADSATRLAAAPQGAAQGCDSSIAHSPRQLHYLRTSQDSAGASTSLSFRLAQDSGACEAAGAAAPPCCGADTQAVLIELRPSTVVLGVDVLPPLPVSMDRSAAGVQVSGSFEAGVEYELTVRVQGTKELEDVSAGAPGHGANYRLLGGYAGSPYGCCPAFWTDDGVPSSALHSYKQRV